MARSSIPIPGRPVTIQGKIDGQIADLAVDTGQPIMVYDPVDGKFKFLRGENGAIIVQADDIGDAANFGVQTVSTPGVEQTLITAVVPVNKARKISQVFVSASHSGRWTLDDGSIIIGSGRTQSGKHDSIFIFSPRPQYGSGTVFNLKFTANLWTPATNVDAYLFGSDISQ